MDQGQTYNPKCNPKGLPNETLGFCWDGSAHSAHNTVRCSDWLESVPNQEQVSLVNRKLCKAHFSSSLQFL